MMLLEMKCTTTSPTTASNGPTVTYVTKPGIYASLRGGSIPEEGNLYINNRPVCDDHWDLKDADVACRMMGQVQLN